MRSLLALTAVLLAIVVASGCDATDISATQRSSAPVSGLPTVTGAPSSSAPTRTRRPHASRTPTTSAATTGGTPKVTAAATDTANGGSGGTAGIPTSYATASARIAALRSAPHSQLNRFTTTGDAVYCVLKNNVIPTSCELGHGAVRDAKVCGRTMADAVGRIQLGDEGAVPECNSDTIREPGARVVAAPAVVSAGDVSCAVERIGVTCVSTRSRAGFFLTPGKYATFSS